MAGSNISIYENSIQDGQPIECYKFMHQGVNYLYTSHCRDVTIVFPENGQTEKYVAEYIERTSIKPASKGDAACMTIDVSKDQVIAKMWQGPPPETPVTVKIYRLHEQDHSKVDVIFYGRISQANFEDSRCHFTVKLENWLSKEISNGKHQYFCNNVIFDSKCRLVKTDWLVDAVVDRVVGLNVYSPKFAEYPDGYFAGGSFYYGDNVRMISEHVKDCVKLKYPFISAPRNYIKLTPGCNHLFRTCALKFHNTLNFSGFPYVPPTDPGKNPTGKGVYWIDSLVVQRDTNGFVGSINL